MANWPGGEPTKAQHVLGGLLASVSRGNTRDPRAKLTVQGRQLLVERVLQLGWNVPMAAEAQGCSAATGYKWIRRFTAEGAGGLHVPADPIARPSA